ncbi:50S ribosomal protein L21 [candidate division WS6 bacterium RIFOXYC1_FULL_33_10]|uniref:Large ribosomal subunit protein bL21 n=1 Tax=candidate division WS6 bacterium RIFOXYC1_FULL_33_10 TaxID=1802606 RepID=A0A1F4UL79_9BACT|nr:MAG: 50S ribosomal protein L21 [candidate division WS6 bacterium RIFOXYC1_FULL_33_10]
MTKVENDKKFAVIKISGTQLKVFEGKEYEINKIEGNKGDKVEVSDVLLVVNGDDIKMGDPLVKDSKVTLEITSQKKDTKVDVLKYKAKSRYRKSMGHRALISRVLVKEIK